MHIVSRYYTKTRARTDSHWMTMETFLNIEPSCGSTTITMQQGIAYKENKS